MTTGEQPRVYGQWAGNKRGSREDPKSCIQEVYGRDYIGHQCYRSRGHGPNALYCAQHAKMHEAQS
jgi:hypothetical protein